MQQEPTISTTVRLSEADKAAVWRVIEDGAVVNGVPIRTFADAVRVGLRMVVEAGRKGVERGFDCKVELNIVKVGPPMPGATTGGGS